MSESAPPFVAALEGPKAARFNAQTMLIPSPLQVRDAIASIPHGQSKTVLQLREELAKASGADVTCPRATTLCWQLVAEATEEDRLENAQHLTPWWRVTKDKKPNPKLPGGVQRHRELLLNEGIKL